MENFFLILKSTEEKLLNIQDDMETLITKHDESAVKLREVMKKIKIQKQRINIIESKSNPVC